MVPFILVSNGQSSVLKATCQFKNLQVDVTAYETVLGCFVYILFMCVNIHLVIVLL